MNPWLIFLIVVIAGSWLLEVIVECLNLKAVQPDLPDEFKDVYDEEKYAKSQTYLGDTTRFGLFSATLSTIALLLVIFLGGFEWADQLARSWFDNNIARGLAFAGIFALASMIFNLPTSFLL